MTSSARLTDPLKREIRMVRDSFIIMLSFFWWARHDFF